jgi:8-oxo-dGTP diphosphatase/2-hydroxy-dATP diphosphatase
MNKLLTLCMVHNGSQLLLGMKKRGFGEGKWNGFGGKVNPGEDIEAAARRELFEEAGITAQELRKHGRLMFQFEGNPEILEVHVFSASAFDGKPSESDEMRPRWFQLHEIPYENMWPDDKHWLPMLIEGKKFSGNFLFRNENILKLSLEIDHEYNLV